VLRVGIACPDTHGLSLYFITPTKGIEELNLGEPTAQRLHSNLLIISAKRVVPIENSPYFINQTYVNIRRKYVRR